MEERRAVLLVANYSNDTGYAWSNIYRLYNSIARACQENNINTCISFAEICDDVSIFDEDIKVRSFVFSPYNITVHSLCVLRSSIKKYNIKSVYFTDLPTWHWLYILLRIWGVKRIIVHCRVSVANPLPVIPEKGFKKIAKIMINTMPAITANYMYAISEFVRDRLVHKNCFSKNRVAKILNGIDIDRFLCSESHVPRDFVSIFCCARATRHKGIPTLIKAAQILKDEFRVENFKIQYAGSGPDEEDFKLLTKKLGVDNKIEFLGMLESTHVAACASDIIVVPSEWGEGFGSTVAEGMAAGKAVVATRAGGIPEVIGNQECGVLVTPGDSHELATALRELINNDETRINLGKKARQRAREHFSEDMYHQKVVERLLQDIQP